MAEGSGQGGRGAMGRALGYLRGYRLDSAGALFSLLVVSAANLAAPQMIRMAVDSGLARGDGHKVVLAVAGLVAIAVIRGIFNFLQGFLAALCRIVGEVPVALHLAGDLVMEALRP